MNVKKVYQPLVDLLESNQDMKVKDLMKEVYALALSSQMSKTHKVDEDGNITHIFCYYHKKWEALSDVEYGTKKSSTTGFNTMCKEGLSHWNKQNRDYKKSKETILAHIVDGTLSPENIEQELTKLEVERIKIVPREDGHGFDL